MRAILSLVVATALLSGGCHSSWPASRPDPPAVRLAVTERLFFGRAIPAGGTVSEAEWQAFLRDFVTPRFPDGLTVWKGNGQWRDPKGEVVSEESFVLEILEEPGERLERSLGEIAAEYKRRFRQDAVLRVTSPAAIRFY